MTAKSKFQNWMEEWKGVNSEEEREILLQKIKNDIGEQAESELLEGMKAVHSMVGELHGEVMSDVKVDTQMVVTPSSEEESALLRSIFKKMNIKFEEIKVA